MKQLLKLLFIYIAFGVVLFMVLSCDPIKRHARMVKKYPHVHTSVTKTDTIKVYLKETSKDTVFYHEFDTITMTKERLRVQLIRSRDSIYLQGSCLDTTIYRTHRYNQYTSTKVQHNWWLYSLLILIVLLILLIFRKILN